jgi:predicted esterase
MMGLNALIIGITPVGRCWYPMPNGVGDQEAAIAGLEPARIAVEEVVKKIEEKYSIPKNRIVLVGYSAGAVVGLLTAAYSDKPFGCVVAHAGAVLDPDMIPVCQFPQSPILLTHSLDDLVFEWNERYVPMLETLQSNNYKVYTATDANSGHMISNRHLKISKLFIKTVLKINDCRPSVLPGG